MQEKQEAARETLRTETPFCDGARELLEKLRASALRVAIVTGASGESVRVISERFGLDALVDVVISADDGARGKPEPACSSAAPGARRSASSGGA